MEEKQAKQKVINKIISAAPKSLWIVLAYICLIPLCLSLSLNMAHIRVDDYINGMLKLELIKAESSTKNFNENKQEILLLRQEIEQLKKDNEYLKSLAHEAGK